MASNKDPFDELTADWLGVMRQAFLDAIREITDRQNLDRIARLLENGDIEGAIQAVGLDPLDFRGLDFTISDLFRAGGERFAQEVPAVRAPTGNVVQFLFNVRNPRAEAIVRQRSSNLITGIVSGQREMIRVFLQDGLRAGQNPRTTALDLVGRRSPITGSRIGGVIGLTQGQEAWQRSYAADIASNDPTRLRSALNRGLRDRRFDASIEKAIRTGEPIPAATRQKMIVSYRNKSLKFRADTIARNETIQSLGRAQSEAWQQAIDGGQVREELITKTPITAGDERVRFNHREVAEMNKDGVAWGEPYKVPTGMGLQMHAPYEGEVGCRCRERVRVRRGDNLR